MKAEKFLKKKKFIYLKNNNFRISKILVIPDKYFLRLCIFVSSFLNKKARVKKNVRMKKMKIVADYEFMKI